MKTLKPLFLTVPLFAAIASVGAIFPASGDTSRAEFAKAMGTIKPGMTAAQVEEALGKPDDIATSADSRMDFTRGAETWAYGTDGHCSFPTLGSLAMHDGKVQAVHGGGGVPPDPKMFDEAALRKILRIIDTCESDNPLDLIRIVNALQPLGKEKALAAIDEYLRVDSHYGFYEAGENLGVYSVLRLLFDVPDDPGYMPRMMVGGPDPTEPADPKILPRFPLAVIDDIPLNLVYGYSLGGEAQRVQEHVEYFRGNGRLRAHPLHPGDDPLGVLAKIQGTPRWLYGAPGVQGYERGEARIANQLLALVESVYWMEPDFRGQRFTGDSFQPEDWKQITKEFSELRVKWDATQNCYTFADGTTLPEIKKQVYGRLIWDLPFLKPDGRLIIERLNRNWVRVVLWNQGKNAEPPRKSTISVYKSWDQKHPLVQLEVLPGETVTEFALGPGMPVDAVATMGGKTFTQPKMVP